MAWRPYLGRPALLAALSAGVLAGCSAAESPDFGLTPPAAIGGGAATAAIQPEPASPPAASASQSAFLASQPASTGTVGSVQFLPLVGAPPATVAALSQALAVSAAESGIAILPSGDPVAPLRLKGYFSAMSEGSGTVVVYVWDVVDPAGTRITRIQGQETIARSAADPWSAVDQAALARIAATTLQAFRRQVAANG
jgi:hypothetical protein